MLQTYAFRNRVGVTHWLSGSPVVVGIIDSVVTGVLAAIVCQAAGGGDVARTIAGVVVAVATVVVLGAMTYRKIHQASREYHPQFPS